MATGTLATDNPRRGILMMLGAIAFFTVMDALAKGLTADNPPMQVVWARYTGQVLWTVILLAPRLPRLMRTRYPGLQLMRSIFVFGATFSFYLALSELELAEATAIFEVAPLITTLLAMIFLGEKVGIRRWLALFCGLIGALVIIRPGFDVFTPYALLPVCAASCYAAFSIATRKLGAEESPWTSFVYTALFGAVVSSLLVIPVWQMPSTGDALLMGLIGLVGGTGQFLLILAFRSAPASLLAPFGYSGLALAALWGVLFFGEWPDIWTWTGATLIIGAGLFVWYRENRSG